LVGRLLHETGSLPEGKLEMLKAVSARRGMPFEWSFLLDALQTERDQGITIDTTQIRFRTRSRDVVLIDAPGHAEFLRNMITGASQADGAVLIIDALEGVRDQTRRHGYLLHLLGVKQVAVVVNQQHHRPQGDGPPQADRIGLGREVHSVCRARGTSTDSRELCNGSAGHCFGLAGSPHVECPRSRQPHGRQ
jgi:translation elongation factor EF-Tu-like GTPase